MNVLVVACSVVAWSGRVIDWSGCMVVSLYVWLYVWLYVCLYVWLYVWLYVSYCIILCACSNAGWLHIHTYNAIRLRLLVMGKKCVICPCGFVCVCVCVCVCIYVWLLG